MNPIPRTGDSISRRVLEEILKQTQSLNVKAMAIHPDELDLLIEVAKRLRGVEFQLDPVVIELVRVTLARQFKDTGQTEDQITKIASVVAGTLIENPEAESQLRSLWKLLSAVEE